MRHDRVMNRRSWPRVVAATLVVSAVVGLAGGAPRAEAVSKPPKAVACGDIVGGTWSVRDRLSGKGLSGSHYTVHATNFPCAKARMLVVKLTRRKSLGPGPTALLPGFMCISGIPKGVQLQHGGCSVGTSPNIMPAAGSKVFSWQACVAIPARHEHPTCTTRRSS
jgi:hypothetical protein